jgi:endonuclease/exonuclease/phosphatase (EEP) superfamily protein YafD
MDLIRILLFALTSVAVLVTLLPLWRTTYWWVRIWEFPRFQIAVVAMAIVLGTFLLRPPAMALDWLLLAAALGVVIWQFVWIYPYLPGASRVVRSCDTGDPDPHCIALLTTNVLQTSRGSDRLLEIIHDANPDVFLAVEADEWWAARLRDGLQSHYPHQISQPLSNGYGLALFSRLELVEPEIRFVLDEAIPSMRTKIRLRSGDVIHLYGVHPRPPSVMQDSTERDLELLKVGLEIEALSKPAIVLGDLNDVAWSATTWKLMRKSNLLDPRKGRGFYNTYPARWPGLRYPLDYVFTTRHFCLRRMRVLPGFGSDHLPLVAELKLESSPGD